MFLLALLACGGDKPAATPPTPSRPLSAAPAPPPAALETESNVKGPVVVPPPVSADPARAAADEAFSAAMRAHQSGGDSAALVKSALDAYAHLPVLDSDGRFHVEVLQAAAGDYPAAKATAEALLADHPNHLLAIGGIARAAKEAGNAADAKTWYQRYLIAWDAPRETLPEYTEHASLLTRLRTEASQYVGGVTPAP